MTDTADVLEGGGPTVPDRRKVVLRLSAAVAAVGLALGGTSFAQDRAGDDLLRAAAAGERTADYAAGVVAGVVEYAEPQLDGAQTPADVQAGLARLVEQAAAREVPALAARLDAVERTWVPPWAGSMRRARAATADYLQARLDRLEAVARSYASYGQGPPTRLRARARAALVELVGERRADEALPQPLSPPASSPRTK